MLSRPEGHRHLFKSPFGKLYPDIREIVPLLAGRTVYAVGDIVTHRLLRNGIRPDIAIVDGHTMREPCGREPADYRRKVTVPNPPGKLSTELIDALTAAVSHPPVLIFVEGEEDLAVIPLVIAAPDGAFIVYGQPGEGVVLREVDRDARRRARELLAVFEEE